MRFEGPLILSFLVFQSSNVVKRVCNTIFHHVPGNKIMLLQLKAKISIMLGLIISDLIILNLYR